MKKLCAYLVCFITPNIGAYADWQLLEDFQDGSSFESVAGPEPALIPDPSNPANTVLEVADTVTVKRDLAVEEQVADASTATFFYQALLVEGREVDAFLGLTDSDTGTNWGDYVCYAGIVDDNAGSNHVRARLGDEMGGGTNESLFSPVAPGAFYSIWLVVDLVANRYDVHLDGPGLEGQTLVAEDYTFRSTGDPEALDALLLKEGGFGDQPLLFDNLYIDTTGQNLTRPPIPVLSSDFRIVEFDYFPGASVELTWTSISGNVYGIERSTDALNWRQLDEQVTADSERASAELFGDDITAAGGRLFFRVRDLGVAAP